MAAFTPPPTYADPVVVDQVSRRSQFNPIWLKWFLDIAQYITENSGGTSTVQHNATLGKQGGATGEYYHFTAAEHATLVAFTATFTGTGPIVKQTEPTLISPNINNIDFATSLVGADAQYRLKADITQGTLNLGMGFDDVNLSLGMGEYYPPCRNTTGSTIANGRLVGFSGVSSGDPTIQPFIADGSMSPEYAMGVTTMEFLNNARGIVTKFGYVRGVNTTGALYGETWGAGTVLYASPTNAGGFTHTQPLPPNIIVAVAVVMTVSATDGILLVRVTPQPRLFYGVFSDSTTQSIGAANTPQTVTFNATDVGSGFSRGTPTSRIVAANPGWYNFQFSGQLRSTNSSSVSVFIWFRKNGVDIANSATEMTIKSNSDVLVPAWNFEIQMGAGDYFEIVWAADSTSVSFAASAAQTSPYARPAIPSMLLSVNQVNQ